MSDDAAILCVLAICLTIIIVSGYGPVVWGGILAVLGWLLSVWLWCVVAVVVIAVIVILLALLCS